MKILTVAHFTLLRMLRSRYALAGAVTIAALIGVFMLSVGRAAAALPDNLQWPLNLARTALWLAAIWLGLQLIHDDLGDGAARSTLTRPISLIEYVLGKALAGAAALTAFALAAGGTLAVAALLRGAPFQWEMLLYLPATLPAHATAMALAMLLSLAMPRFAAGALVLAARDGFYTDRAIEQWAQFLPPSYLELAAPIGKLLYWICPPTSTLFNSYGVFIHTEPNPSVYLLAIPYALHYCGLACLLTAWLLSRREL